MLKTGFVWILSTCARVAGGQGTFLIKCASLVPCATFCRWDSSSKYTCYSVFKTSDAILNQLFHSRPKPCHAWNLTSQSSLSLQSIGTTGMCHCAQLLRCRHRCLGHTTTFFSSRNTGCVIQAPHTQSKPRVTHVWLRCEIPVAANQKETGEGE